VDLTMHGFPPARERRTQVRMETQRWVPAYAGKRPSEAPLALH